MSYSSASRIASYCYNLLDGQVTWSTTTNPTLNQVKDFLSAGCAIIETELLQAGYSIPVASGTSAYTRVELLETWFGVSQAELVRTNTTFAADERTRGSLFYKMFLDGLKELVNGDLTNAGLTKNPQGTIYVGGISETTKDTYDNDTDRIEPRFKRGQFRTPGTSRPLGSIETDDDEYRY